MEYHCVCFLTITPSVSTTSTDKGTADWRCDGAAAGGDFCLPPGRLPRLLRLFGAFRRGFQAPRCCGLGATSCSELGYPAFGVVGLTSRASRSRAWTVSHRAKLCILGRKQQQKDKRQRALVSPAALIVAGALTIPACSGGDAEARKRISREYDKTTGKLQLLKYDSNGNGKVDMWSYMDGARIVRVEIDKDEDGKIDRWEYYGPDQKIEKVGFSRSKDGKEDAWSYAGPDGSIVRIDVSTRRDGKVNRTEHYKNDLLVSAEEDSDADGQIDKWEIYDGTRLASVAFDTMHRGKPDRRLVYGADGSARLEVDRAGTGNFVAVTDAAPAARIPKERRPSG